jgi:hypothetical protein
MATTAETASPLAPKMPDVGVLDTIKKTRGEDESKTMNALQVVQTSMANQLPPGVTMDTFLRKLASALQDPNNKLVQIGNSAFMVTLVGDGVVEFHTFSAEQPQKLLKNYLGLAKLLKNQGIKKATTYSDRPEFVDLAKKSGLPVKVGQSQKMMGKEMKPVYTFELDL